jgi:hypothetical protein
VVEIGGLVNSGVRRVNAQILGLRVTRTRGCESATGSHRSFAAAGLGSWRNKRWESRVAKLR